jgi:hypothetical protein
MVPRRFSHAIILLVVFAAATVVVALPRVSQDPAYHAFADRRTMFGVPNALNVLSNIAFLVAGGFGLWVLGDRGRAGSMFAGVPATQARRAFAALFAGTLLAGFGSAYYHLAPDSARLVWDRLPMTIGFMGLLTAIVGERVGARPARVLFVPLLAVGAFSVAYWGWTEARGAGDLRPYGLVQFGSLAIVLLMLPLYRSSQAGTAYLVAALTAYGAAKLCEAFDVEIFSIGEVISGHTLKHLAAAVGLGIVALMLRRRATC